MADSDMDTSSSIAVMPIAYSLVTVFGVIGNIGVFFVIVCNRSLQDTTSVLILNLAIADLTFLTFCVPFTAYSYTRQHWAFGTVACYTNIYVQYVSVYASCWTLVVLAFDRFMAVVYPVSAMRFRTLGNAMRACALVWITMLVLNIPVLTTTGIFEYSFDGEERSACLDFMAVATGNVTRWQMIVFYCGFNVGAYLLPLGITCIFYLCMVRRLGRRAVANYLRKSSSRESQRVKRRVTKIVSLVILTFAVCWLPQHIRYALVAFAYPEPIIYDMRVLWYFQIGAQLLAYSNSCINPFLYGLLSERFREGFVSICRRVRGRLRSTNSIESKYSLTTTNSAPSTQIIERRCKYAPLSMSDNYRQLMLVFSQSRTRSSSDTINNRPQPMVTNIDGHKLAHRTISTNKHVNWISENGDSTEYSESNDIFL